MNRSPDNEVSPENLDQDLERVKAELEEYQGLIEALPTIYEGKFQHQLRDVVQDIRRLLDERQALQQQIERSLSGGQDPVALPAAAREVAEGLAPVASPEPGASDSASVAPQGKVPLILLSVSTALAVAALVAALGLFNRSRQPQLAAPAGPEAPVSVADQAPPSEDSATPDTSDSLRLRARGECWVEVQTLEGRRVFMGTLEDGEEHRLALGEGLRLLVGRPDLLEVAVADEDFRPFGPIERIVWITLRPPVDLEAAS